MNTKIRKVGLSDLEFFYQHKGPMFTSKTPLDSIKSSIFERKDALFLMYEDSLKKGYIGCYMDEYQADLATLFVLEPYRKKGIATALIKALLKHLHAQNIKSISLEVSVENKTAIRLYESFGFKSLTMRKNYYPNQVDALLMSKEIS